MIFVNTSDHAHVLLGPLWVPGWTIEVDLNLLVGSLDCQKWELWGRQQCTLAGGGLADLAVPDVVFDFHIHVGPPVVLLDVFQHFEEAHVACYLGVMALLDKTVMYGGRYDYPKVCAILRPLPLWQPDMQHWFPHFHEGEVWPHHVRWNRAVLFQHPQPAASFWV
jgi:hypothetical protein